MPDQPQIQNGQAAREQSRDKTLQRRVNLRYFARNEHVVEANNGPVLVGGHGLGNSLSQMPVHRSGKKINACNRQGVTIRYPIPLP